MSSPVVRSKNVLKRNSIRFRAALLAVLASFVAGPNAALDAAPEHRDQVPGFYRLKVGDLEVTALYDGTGVFDPHWLNGTTATAHAKRFCPDAALRAAIACSEAMGAYGWLQDTPLPRFILRVLPPISDMQ